MTEQESIIQFEVPNETFLALKISHERIGSELRMLAAVKLYELGAAAGLAGVPRVLFLNRLADYGVDTFRLTEDQLGEEPLSRIICDTSPIQYLRQIGLLNVFHSLAGNIIVPPAVLQELETGRNLGFDLPDIMCFQEIWAKEKGEPSASSKLMPYFRASCRSVRLWLASRLRYSASGRNRNLSQSDQMRDCSDAG